MTDQVTDRADTGADSAAGEADDPAGARATAGPNDREPAARAEPTGRHAQAAPDGQDGADPDADVAAATGAGRSAGAGSAGAAVDTERGDGAGGAGREAVAGTDTGASVAAAAGVGRDAGVGGADQAAGTGTDRGAGTDRGDGVGGGGRAAGTGTDRGAGTDRGDGAGAGAEADLAADAGTDGAGRAPAVDASVARPLHGPDGRDPHLDNVKFVAITLVVAGHAWGPMLAWSQALTGFYLFLYTVHMPIFVMLSGYFSRHFTASPRQARSVVRTIVVPYLLIETGFTLFRYFFGSLQPIEFALQDPWWVTWFLMTLFFWRVTSPLWRVVRFPIVIAVVVMLAAGTQKMTGMLELGRVFGYLPFFVIGLSLRQEHFAKLRTLWARLAAVPVIAGAVYLTYLLAPHASLEWVYWRSGYEQLDVAYPVWAGIKLAQLAATLLVVAAAIALIPARRIPVITAFGAASMYAYLLHGFITKGVDWWSDGYDLMFLHSHLGIALVGLASIVLTLVLCSPPVRVLFSWAIQPRLEGWLRGGPPRA